VENFRPDVKERLGIDYAAMKAVNPRLVYASISGSGRTAPIASGPASTRSRRAWAG
jgi:formyl-CoA transferase